MQCGDREAKQPTWVMPLLHGCRRIIFGIPYRCVLRALRSQLVDDCAVLHADYWFTVPVVSAGVKTQFVGNSDRWPAVKWNDWIELTPNALPRSLKLTVKNYLLKLILLIFPVFCRAPYSRGRGAGAPWKCALNLGKEVPASQGRGCGAVSGTRWSQESIFVGLWLRL